MSRKLILFAAATLALSAFLLAVAYAIGGESVFQDPMSLKGMQPLIDLATRKEWRWSGGDSVALNGPVNLRYQPEGAAGISVSGPAATVEHVQFADGRIATDNNAAPSAGQEPQAVIRGVPIRKFVVNGGQKLELGHVDQDRLDIHVNGSGRVEGDGRVGQLNLMINGSGHAQLGNVAVGIAKVMILGSGKAVVAPHESLDAVIAGSGVVQLAANPKSLNRTVIGSGHIEAEPEVPAPPPIPPAPPPMPSAGQAVLPTPPVPGGTIHLGGDQMIIRNGQNSDLGTLAQDHLDLAVLGHGAVTAAGHVDSLDLKIYGTGTARLGDLKVKDAQVQVMGSGDVTLAPTGNLKVTIMGSGNVTLLTHPAHIERSIMGSGRVIEAP